LKTEYTGNTRFVILSHDASSNALGRALSMGLVAQELGPTVVYALRSSGKRVWKGVAQFGVELKVLPVDWKRQLRSELDGLKVGSDSAELVVWVSKGISPLPDMVKLIKNCYPSAKVILDLDDDDSGLAKSFRSQSLSNSVKLNWFRRRHPRRIAAAQRAVLKQANALTFATHCLRSRYPNFEAVSVRIPHVRINEPAVARRDKSSRVIRIGAFGTLRPHKGAQMLLDLINRYTDIELWTFENCGLDVRTTKPQNWVEIGPTTPISEAYSQIDVAVIAITDDSPAAQVQLPAKLADAMRAGVPIVASETTAIKEIAAGCYEPLLPGSSASDAYQAILRANASGLGTEARQRFLSLLQPPSAAIELSQLLELLANKRADHVSAQ
jgi:glycosyltransferase involved in cell wall biosynthesis